MSYCPCRFNPPSSSDLRPQSARTTAKEEFILNHPHLSIEPHDAANVLFVVQGVRTAMAEARRSICDLPAVLAYLASADELGLAGEAAR